MQMTIFFKPESRLMRDDFLTRQRDIRMITKTTHGPTARCHFPSFPVPHEFLLLHPRFFKYHRCPRLCGVPPEWLVRQNPFDVRAQESGREAGEIAGIEGEGHW